MTTLAFIDNGTGTEWETALLFPHSFQALDYAGAQNADALSLAQLSPFHDQPISAGGAG